MRHEISDIRYQISDIRCEKAVLFIGDMRILRCTCTIFEGFKQGLLRQVLRILDVFPQCLLRRFNQINLYAASDGPCVICHTNCTTLHHTAPHCTTLHHNREINLFIRIIP